MRKIWVLLVAATSVMLPLAGAATANVDPGAAESTFFQLMNAERVRSGLPALSADGGIRNVSVAWSTKLSGAQQLSHNPNFAREISAQVTDKWTRVGENVGRGGSVESLHAAFMASPSHRDNVLGDYNRVGVGVVVDGNGTIWVTFNFLKGPAISTPPAAGAVSVSNADNGGYLVATSAGGVMSYCGAGFHGDVRDVRLAQQVVGIAATPTGGGYWMVARDGGIFSFGDAKFYGSTGGIRLAQPVVGMASTPSGRGYWLVASDGGIFAYGDARFYGSTGGIRLAQPVVGMASTPSGRGYWLVASDGGIFAYGDARFYGSTGGIRLAQPITSMATTDSGNGYWFVAKDGGVFAFGDAAFYGSTATMGLSQPVVGMATAEGGSGYRVVTGDSSVYSFGNTKAASGAGC